MECPSCPAQIPVRCPPHIAFVGCPVRQGVFFAEWCASLTDVKCPFHSLSLIVGCPQEFQTEQWSLRKRRAKMLERASGLEQTRDSSIGDLEDWAVG